MEGSVDGQKGCFCISSSAVIRPCLTIIVDVYQGSRIFIYPKISPLLRVSGGEALTVNWC